MGEYLRQRNEECDAMLAHRREQEAAYRKTFAGQVDTLRQAVRDLRTAIARVIAPWLR